MGTHSETHYSPEQNKLRFAEEVHARTTRNERVIIHYPHLGARKEFWYYIDRNYDEIQNLAQVEKLPTLQRSVLIFDERLLSVAERAIFERLMLTHPVVFFDNFTMLDLRVDKPGVQSYTFVAAPMSAAYRWFVSHKYPPLTLVKRAYLPGECEAQALGVPLDSDEALPEEPADARLLPCYHNLLVDRGAAERAHAIAAAVTARLPAVDATIGQAHVLAAGLRGDKLEIVVLTAGADRGILRYVASGGGKLLPLPSVSVPPPSRWQSGRLYVDSIAIAPGHWDIEAQLVDRATPDAAVLARAKIASVVR
jgi:hypothetical protein